MFIFPAWFRASVDQVTISFECMLTIVYRIEYFLSYAREYFGKVFAANCNEYV